MVRTVFCRKQGCEAEGLAAAPYPGPLGQRVYAEISATAWQQWLRYQTVLINEYRLSLLEAKARCYLEVQMQAFLFGEGELDKPAGYQPPTAD